MLLAMDIFSLVQFRDFSEYRLPKPKSAFFGYTPKSFDCKFIEIIIIREGRKEGRRGTKPF